ncbi:MAG: hypothetical protein HYX74_12265 [Acidobacteria bacterium]|nr:hypothetical protein [Acidobacteriota bacterium]
MNIALLSGLDLRDPNKAIRGEDQDQTPPENHEENSAKSHKPTFLVGPSGSGENLRTVRPLLPLFAFPLALSSSCFYANSIEAE